MRGRPHQIDQQQQPRTTTQHPNHHQPSTTTNQTHHNTPNIPPLPQDFALLVRELVGGGSEIVHLPATQDDPSKRRPDISVAKEVRAWVCFLRVVALGGLRWWFVGVGPCRGACAWVGGGSVICQRHALISHLVSHPPLLQTNRSWTGRRRWRCGRGWRGPSSTSARSSRRRVRKRVLSALACRAIEKVVDRSRLIACLPNPQSLSPPTRNRRDCPHGPRGSAAQAPQRGRHQIEKEKKGGEKEKKGKDRASSVPFLCIVSQPWLGRQGEGRIVVIITVAE